MKSSEHDSVPVFVPILVISTSLLVIGYFLWSWHWNYSSDTVLVGLAAKRFLSHGEVPIFVPQVGYQGLLLEVPLTAWVFKWMGVSPYTLNVVPTVFYLLLLVAYFFMVRLAFGDRMAWLGALLLVLSPPQWYAVVLRSIPNYPQTYLAGILLFLIYVRVVRNVLKEPSETGKNLENILWAALFGGIAGFFFYTYGQIVYFFAAITLHASLFYWRAQYQRGLSFWEILVPVQRSASAFVPWLIKRVCLVLFLLSALSALVPWGELQIARNRPDLFKFVFLSGLSFVALHLVEVIQRYGSWLLRYRWLGAAAALAFIVGYSPKLYYNLVLGLKSQQRLSIGGGWQDLGQRLFLLFSSLYEFYFTRHTLVVVVLLGLILSGVLYFLWCQSRLVKAFIQAKLPLESFTQIAFALVLLPGILIPLLSSTAFGGPSSIRYALALFIPISVSIAFGLVRAWNTNQTKWKVPSALVLAFLLGSSLQSYRQTVGHQQKVKLMDSIAGRLRETDTFHAFADYWWGYSLHFLHPSLAIDPLQGNYLNYWQESVRSQPQVALICPQEEALERRGNQIIVFGTPYQVIREERIQDCPLMWIRK